MSVEETIQNTERYYKARNGIPNYVERVHEAGQFYMKLPYPFLCLEGNTRDELNTRLVAFEPSDVVKSDLQCCSYGVVIRGIYYIRSSFNEDLYFSNYGFLTLTVKDIQQLILSGISQE